MVSDIIINFFVSFSLTTEKIFVIVLYHKRTILYICTFHGFSVMWSTSSFGSLRRMNMKHTRCTRNVITHDAG